VNVLSGRVSAIVNGGEIVTGFRVHKKGLGQGSPISPILFSIYMRKLSSVLPIHVMSIQCADNFTIWFSYHTIDGAYVVMKEALNNIYIFLKNRKRQLSTTKTVIMFFNTKRSDRLPEFQIQGVNLPTVSSTKMLGLIIDNKLSWKDHIDNLVVNQKRALNILRVLCGTDFGADAKSLLTLYRGLIRSKIDYGSILYASASKNILRKIVVVHYQGLRLCIGSHGINPNTLYTLKWVNPRLQKVGKIWP